MAEQSKSAFPAPGEPGMSLREYIATAVYAQALCRERSGNASSAIECMEVIAQGSVTAADILLRELAK